VKVLAIDGGGIRGLIPALVLEEIERRTGRLAAELFDLVAGTSTGAIIACALTRPRAMPAARIAELYAQRDPLYRAVADHVIASDRDEVMRFARAWDTQARPAPESAR